MELKDVIASLNAGYLLPEGLMVVALVTILLLDLAIPRMSNSIAWQTRGIILVPIISLSLAIVVLWGQLVNPSVENMAFYGSFQSDSLSVLFRILLATSSLICIALSFEYLERTQMALTEYLVLLLTATLGGMLLAGANDLLTIFVALETLGLASYLLAGSMKSDSGSNEAALKYLLVGAVSSGLFLYGISWLYGISGGELEIHALANTLAANDMASSSVTLGALVLMSVGIAFKLSAAPFHQWTPDVYQGSPTPLVAFLAVGSKAAGLALAVRVLTILFPSLSFAWHSLFEVFAVLSMVLGNLMALTQTSVKRLLGYSSIGQAGFLLIGLLAGHQDGYTSMVTYLVIYLFMNLGAFACVILFGLRTGTDQIRDYAGLFHKDPLLATGLSICLLSLGGFPPLAGFFGKLYLFWAGWQEGCYQLVWVGLLTSVISIYYYLGIIKIMLVKSPPSISVSVQSYPESAWTLQALQPLEVSLVVCVTGTILIGIAGNSMFELIRWSIMQTPTLI
jgi:NAD(P)H-quinone oxidoreductase subunit 2